ncbi:MAG TPA: NAD(FAD)-dependent dehydrogenase, partial [Pseudomonadaceae bacterium]|nr:NAD(FAD)-dependent dehydrogenase [Pseudomonadaceae bacterium]
MEIKQLSPEFSVSAQITSKDLAQLQAQGITTLIGNRPDGEGGAEQPAWDELVRAAEALGIKAHLVPVVFDTINSADVRRFAALLQSGERVHAFCRSCARSTTLWALARVAQGETA